MLQDFSPGDYIVFQIESGYSLLRIIDIDLNEGDPIWHLAGYDEYFLDVESAESSIKDGRLPKPIPVHLVLTNRAFESTQTAKLFNVPLNEDDRESYLNWLADADHEVSDRSVRLMLGLR